ncbi:MAG: metallophosphoesterase family protein [Alphaproteobacteria bacterium]|jgi:serine/threonine protein phosphatase 1|nr:metallophosphoesterase family protein [Alphaproteobacteria bacterium]
MKLSANSTSRQRLYAVGDIHGRIDLLSRLLAEIEADAMRHEGRKKKLIFLGDYVDRGIDSRAVLERLTQGFAAGLDPVFLRGNHEDMMLTFMKGRLEVADLWLTHGGVPTLASYGLHAFVGHPATRTPAFAKELAQKVPPHHHAFLENTIFSATFGDYYFVHAGVRPDVPLDKQKPDQQMWIRGEFLYSTHDFGKIVVHGHTIVGEPEVRPNRIDIDTGAYATGRLTCLVLDGATRSFLST